MRRRSLPTPSVRVSLSLALAGALWLFGAPPATASPTAPLDHEGRWLTDAQGRTVILHGFNMVHKVGSYRPEDTGFGADDARFLRRHGFNTIRLGIIYKGLEPDPPNARGEPSYDLGYLKSIARTERILAKRRIFTLLDFHQDLFNERFEGEGWPDWQTIDDGVPSEPKQGFPGNYIVNLGLQRAFDNFWANTMVEGRGLQDAFAEAWRLVASRFRDKPYVAGYNLLNEPWPGSAFVTDACANVIGCLSFDKTTLQPFSERVIAAIREADPDKLAFYEPLVTFDFGADTQHGDTGDANAGFSFHNYCLPGAFGGPGSGPACESLEEMVFDNADKQSEQTGDVPFLTEFGATDDLVTIERIVRLADEHMVSWQYWHYCDCSDPTTSGPGIQSLVIDPTKPPTGENVKRDKLLVLERPYPQVVAGTPESYGFDPESRRFTLEYGIAAPGGEWMKRSLETEVYLPRIQYPDGYKVSVTGAKVVSKPGAKLLRLERRRTAELVELTVSPVAAATVGGNAVGSDRRTTAD